MRILRFLLVPMVFLLLADSSRALPTNNGLPSSASSNLNTHQQIIDLLDKKIDEKLNKTDFSDIEINELKAFVHKAIKSQDLENLKQSHEHVLKSTEAALGHYKEHKRECKIQQKFDGSQNMAQMNENCFRSFIGSLCPHWPFCK